MVGRGQAGAPRGDGAIPLRNRLETERLYGVHPVTQALRARRRTVREVWVARERGDRRAREILGMAAEQGIPVARPPRGRLDREVPGGGHQGVLALAGRLPLLSEEEILEAGGRNPFLMILEGVEDPRNLGALLRSAVAAGVDGVLLGARRIAPLSPVVARASAGGSEWARIGASRNVGGLLRRLRARGVWTVGLDPGGDRMWTDFDYRQGVAVVLGGEGRGLRPLLRRMCDLRVRIPMEPGMESLNVAVAAGIVLFEVVRQRASRKK